MYIFDKTSIPKNGKTKNKVQDLTITTNISYKDNVLLQTSSMSLDRVNNNKRFEITQLMFDSGSQRSCISKNVINV